MGYNTINLLETIGIFKTFIGFENYPYRDDKQTYLYVGINKNTCFSVSR